MLTNAVGLEGSVVCTTATRPEPPDKGQVVDGLALQKGFRARIAVGVEDLEYTTEDTLLASWTAFNGAQLYWVMFSTQRDTTIASKAGGVWLPVPRGSFALTVDVDNSTMPELQVIHTHIATRTHTQVHSHAHIGIRHHHHHTTGLWAVLCPCQGLHGARALQLRALERRACAGLLGA